MGKVPRQHVLNWSMELLDSGFTCFTLLDSAGRRWGWVINGSKSPIWIAHIGDFGQCLDEGLPAIPVKDEAETFEVLESAKVWVEDSIAARWRELVLADDAVVEVM